MNVGRDLLLQALRGAAVRPLREKRPKIRRRTECKYSSHSKLYSRLVNRLLLTPGAIVPIYLIADAIWGDRPDGGPLGVQNLLAVMVCRLRKEGLPIKTCYGRGFSYDWRWHLVEEKKELAA